MTATESTSPRTGDLILAPDPSVPQAYTLAVSPGLPQIRYASYQKAVEVAGRWVARKGGAIWVRTDGGTCRRLALNSPTDTGAPPRAGSDKRMP